MHEELMNLSQRYNVPYSRVLELYKDRNCHNSSEYLVCCKIQSLLAKQYLKDEFGIDCDKPEVMKKSRGYVFLCPTTSGNIVIK